MISWKRFLELRSGDLVIWRGKYLRTVIKGPAEDRDRPAPTLAGHAVVHFAIRRRSWRERPETCYNFSDMRDKLTFTGLRNPKLLLESEWLTLNVAQFTEYDVAQEFAWQEAEARRMGRPLCRAYPRLKRLLERLT